MSALRTDDAPPAATKLYRAVRGARLSSVMIAGLFVIVIIANGIVQPTFFTQYAMTSTFATLVPLVLIALAQTMVVLTGGIDLSIGASVTLASVVAVVVMDGRNSHAVLGVIIAVAVGGLCGLANGLIVALLRLQPIIVTFASASVFAGAALLVLPKPGGAVPDLFTGGYRASVGPLPVAVLLVLLVLGLWYLMTRTRYLRHVYAVGGDKGAAYASLVPVQRVQVLAYVLCGALGGLAAIALLANSGSGDPFIGLELMLNSVAAVVIGGTPLMGGRGGGVGSIIGAIVLALIANIVFFAGVPTNFRPLVSGVVIIAALAVSAISMSDRGRTS